MDDPDPAAALVDPKTLTPGERLACWTLGTFETCLLVAAGVLYLYLKGGLNATGKSFEEAGDLGSLGGIALFVVLWGCTVYSTTRGYRESQILRHPGGPIDLVVVSSATTWGGFNGVIFLGALVWIAAPIVTGIAVAHEGPSGFVTFLAPFFVGLFGALPAFIIGSIVGFALSPIVSLLLFLARLPLAPPQHQPAPQ